VGLAPGRPCLSADPFAIPASSVASAQVVRSARLAAGLAQFRPKYTDLLDLALWSDKRTRVVVGTTWPTSPLYATIRRMSLDSDRRKERSDDALVALYYQLLHTHREACLDTIVVADASGIVVAGAGPWAACEELAAYAPLLVGSRPAGDTDEACGPERSRLAELGCEVDVKPVRVDGQTVLLCVRGARRRDVAVDRAAEGVARILATAA